MRNPANRLAPVLTSALITAALAVVLLAAPDARGARYSVAQCGWKIGHDASWLETSSNKFNSSTWCAVPAGSDPWDGVHVTSGTRPSTVSVTGTRFARWRWQAPQGTGIVTVQGDRWHVLKDNFEHRLGSVPQGGSFRAFAEHRTTDTVRRDFSASFSPHAAAFESRLLCARTEDRFCTVSGTSLAGVRGLTITLDDPARPSAAISGQLTSGNWLRGDQALEYSGSDAGSGLRYAQTQVDGAMISSTEHACSMALIQGQWRGKKMQPCPVTANGTHTIRTAALSDGPHELRHCAVDFAGNTGCPSAATIRTDNTAPAAPRSLTVAGGDGWRRNNGFTLTWAIPPQGAAAPVTGARYRVTGPASFDTGPLATSDVESAPGIQLPAAGEYQASVWLVDAAGNEDTSATAGATLRFDDVPPSIYLLDPGASDPERLMAPVSDAHSGPAGGLLAVRREGSERWHDLQTSMAEGEDGRMLIARFPSDDLPPGRYAVRATAFDHAGNETVTTRRGNGAHLVLDAPLRTETDLRARLVGPRGSGTSVRVPFAAGARLSGRLLRKEGGGLPGQEVAVTVTPSPGSGDRPWVRTVRTGSSGRFLVRLAPGTSRRVGVTFAGSRRFGRSSVGPLELGVLGSLSLRAVPRGLATGERIRFSGLVRRGAARRLPGTLVAIRYLERSTGAWRPVLVTRTRQDGTYAASYRFRHVTGIARIRFRASLLPSPEFPYLPAASRVVEVRVRG
jgi:5-hydroxyisourate hydrolase-like protein (transthyretin family)